MSAETLRRAAAKLRDVPPAFACTCEDWTDHWFDRSICPEPCGSMHDICVECGRPQGGCLAADQARKPTAYDLAVADWLDDHAETAELFVAREIPASAWSMNWQTSHNRALTVARAYLGESA